MTQDRENRKEKWRIGVAGCHLHAGKYQPSADAAIFLKPHPVRDKEKYMTFPAVLIIYLFLTKNLNYEKQFTFCFDPGHFFSLQRYLI